jgi:hypothetical protein
MAPVSSGYSIVVATPSRIVVGAFTMIACVTPLTACATGTRGAPELGNVETSNEPYYFVGPWFDGLRLSHVEPYERGVADIAYGTCEPPPEGGCAPPLDLQHRLCLGRVTVVVFVGANAKPGRAARAAKALRPLSRGASNGMPHVAFDRSPAC